MDDRGKAEVNFTKKKMVTIIAESALEALIIKNIERLGASGYTLMYAMGNGERGVRKGDWDQNKNIFLQTVCSDEVAHAIMDYLYDHYYEDYAIIAYATEVDIHRNSKF
jgi:nitrogen regulatory protein P-II 2